MRGCLTGEPRGDAGRGRPRPTTAPVVVCALRGRQAFRREQSREPRRLDRLLRVLLAVPVAHGAGLGRGLSAPGAGRICKSGCSARARAVPDHRRRRSARTGSVEGSGVAVAIGGLALWAGSAACERAQARWTPCGMCRGTAPGFAKPIEIAQPHAARSSEPSSRPSRCSPARPAGVRGGTSRACCHGRRSPSAVRRRATGCSHRPGWHGDGVAPRRAVGGVGWTVLLALGGWIVSRRIASSNQVYGTFAVVIGLLGWIYLGAQIALLGAAPTS